MKGKIFIAWSGENSLAKAVKSNLESQEYIGVVGGESGRQSGLYVGDVVLREIDQCNQAIFVVQKKADGTISNNLMFELGYSLCRFNSNKIHVYYIDIDSKDEQIPSDLQGIWARHLNTKDYPDIAQEIIKEFLINQRNIIPENKMAIIDSYHSLKEKLRKYPEAPHCSEYELAQYVLFFSQGAYMFDNEREGLTVLQELIKNLPSPAEELDLAIRFAICYLKVFTSWQRQNDLLFLDRKNFKQIRQRLEGILEKVLTWPENDFTLWFLVLLQDTLNYAMVLYSFCPALTPEISRKALDTSLGYAQACLENCLKLIDTKPNRQCAQLFAAYMYRNLATYHTRTGGDPDVIYDYLTKSFNVRQELMDYYEVHNINAHLYDNFEMEYFLALAELLGSLNDPEVMQDFLEDCQEYIQRVKDQSREKSHFISKIEAHVAALVAAEDDEW